jgi:hypothetical protein
MAGLTGQMEGARTGPNSGRHRGGWIGQTEGAGRGGRGGGADWARWRGPDRRVEEGGGRD